MRLITRTLAFAIVILAALWFTTANAREVVTLDFAFLRVRASLPLVVFGCVLFGMALSLLAGWWAERRERERVVGRGPALFEERGDPDAEPRPPRSTEHESMEWR